MAFDEVELVGLGLGLGLEVGAAADGFRAFSSSSRLLNRLDLLNMDMAFPQMTIRRGYHPSVRFAQRLSRVRELTSQQV